jgi:hypothetical protein
MIHVERRQTDEDGRLIEPSRKWFDKAEELTKRAISEGAEHEPDNHYRHDEVRKALEKLFRAKCAYCELRLAGCGNSCRHRRLDQGIET